VAGVSSPCWSWLGYDCAGIEHLCLFNSQTPTIAVQATVELRDIPVAVSTAFLFQLLGQAIFVAIAQAVFLNQLLPQMQAVNPDLTAIDILQAGATGLKTLVTEAQLPTVLVDYANSLDAVFKVDAAIAAVAVTLAFFIEWKSIKKDKKPKDVEGS